LNLRFLALQKQQREAAIYRASSISNASRSSLPGLRQDSGIACEER
jgi:hypothetical protein